MQLLCETVSPFLGKNTGWSVDLRQKVCEIQHSKACRDSTFMFEAETGHFL